MDQPKIERLLRLMKMLTGNVTYTVEDLSARLDMSVRTIYRYIDTFRSAGFVIKQKGKVYRIDKNSPYFKDISRLIHFTEEEAYILKNAIESIDETNLLKQNLKKKLYTLYDYRILAETVTKGKNALNVNHLVEAIEEGKQVILKEYSSVNSNIIRNRLVEPFAFTTNYIQVWAFDTESKTSKLFKVSRMNEVEVLKSNWKYDKLHKSGFIDIFRISSFETFPVKLSLGMRAAMLLMEEYPLAERDMIRKGKNTWVLKTKVSGFEGIGRFILGLSDDIKILESQELKDYVKDKVLKMALAY
jgi:predicted DNA-binding transcriptional regulator YafY